MQRLRWMRLTAGYALAVLALLLVPVHAQEGACSYHLYRQDHEQSAFAQESIVLSCEEGVAEGAATMVEPLDGKNALIWDEAAGNVSWRFSVQQTGLYQLRLCYQARPARGNDIRIAFTLDGSVPFAEAESVTLRRLYEDREPIKQTLQGDDIRPAQREVFQWECVALADDQNHYAEPFALYLTAGEHFLSLSLLEEAVALAEITLTAPTALESYAQYQAEIAGAHEANASITLQGEQAALKSSPVLTPQTDRSSAATEPSDPVKIRLNTMGGWAWKQQGEWIEWRFDVAEEGLYTLNMRVQQNFLRQMQSTRRISIDGEVLFAEANAAVFPYAFDWYLWTWTVEGQPVRIWLSEGQHTLRVEVAAGATAEPLRALEQVVQELNAAYRRIIMVTGDNADGERITIDLNRDFHLEKRIPGLTADLTRIAQELHDQHAVIEGINGSGGEASTLLEVAAQLESFCQKPETIPSRLESYKSNVSSMASWVLQMREQPLEIDRIIWNGAALPPPNVEASFLQQAAFRAEAFTGSFTQDFSALGAVYEGAEHSPLTVWISASDLGANGVSSGRDQAQVLKTLIDDLFVPQTGIPVNLSLIDGSGTLMQATLGGKGPDVALMVYKDLPVNLAMRGALLDLSQREGFTEAASEFYPSALIPYQYQGGMYALPETQTFDMMFYRKDILDEMGFQVPETWTEFYTLAQVIQKNGMQIGVPAPDLFNGNTMGFQAQLYQRGLTYYRDDLSATNFDRPEALDAFKAWTNLYVKYSLPLQFDAFSRFRTGEMPLVISSYTFSNTLAAGAPELQGLWDFAPIPGTLREDGTIDHSEGASGTASVVMAGAQDPEAAFTFLKWWVSSDVQSRFGVALEGLMGPAARYPTANRIAFEKLPWTQKQADTLASQWAFVKDIPQLPGNYITNRNLSFAFRKVVYDYANQRETLYQYNREINKEIARKWMEFGKD